MKKLPFSCMLVMILAVSFALAGNSCSKEKKPEEVRIKEERSITIVNNTGSQIKGYQLNVAKTGVEIQKGVPSANSFSVIINESFKNDPDIEVVLIDRAGRAYAKTYNVPLKGNTDAPITAGDRVSQGFLNDKRKDLIDWFNSNK